MFHCYVWLPEDILHGCFERASKKCLMRWLLPLFCPRIAMEKPAEKKPGLVIVQWVLCPLVIFEFYCIRTTKNLKIRHELSSERRNMDGFWVCWDAGSPKKDKHIYRFQQCQQWKLVSWLGWIGGSACDMSFGRMKSRWLVPSWEMRPCLQNHKVLVQCGWTNPGLLVIKRG